MADIRQMVRRESRGQWCDFIQRVRLGLIGALIILIIAGVLSWL